MIRTRLVTLATLVTLVPSLTCLPALAPRAAAQDAPAPATSAASAPPPIYDEAADGRAQVQAALARAARGDRRVLIQWGANWCGWCRLLHASFTGDEALKRELLYEYELVRVDVGRFDKHMDLAASFGAELKEHGIPYLTVLAADGRVLANQPTGPLEAAAAAPAGAAAAAPPAGAPASAPAPGHDVARVLAFLQEHEPTRRVAGDVLADALSLAAREDKRVFLHFGAPWCGWCHRLEDWMAQPRIAELLGRDFVDCRIDVDRMLGGQALLAAHRGGADGGIPWFEFLAADRTVLADSDAAGGNIGFPAAAGEIAHFGAMLRAATRRLTAPEIDELLTSLAKPPAPSLRTRWAAEVALNDVLPEYPRPLLVREAWANLNGPWDYAIRDGAAPQPAPGLWDGKLLVPFAVESQLGGVRRAVLPTERLWYRRQFVAPSRPDGGRLLLHFGAVDHEAEVFLNGRAVGSHRGGYDPFSFDITDALLSAPDAVQELVVAVRDPTDRGPQPRGKQVLDPDGIWYTAVTGIWQTVWLEPVPATHIRALHVVPDLDAATLAVRATVDGTEAATAGSVRVHVVALADGAEVASGDGAPGQSVVLHLASPRAWSPADPFLYDLRVTLHHGTSMGAGADGADIAAPAGKAAGAGSRVEPDAPLDSVESYAGLRSIALGRDARGVTRILLNGEPLFQYGLLDQGWWPDGLYTAPTDEALRFDIEATLRLGFNLARKHVKVEPQRWYSWCDRLGLLVWQDMPSGGNDTPEARAQFADELRRMVDALASHPSIVMWVPFNEGWGQHETEATVAWLKDHDPTRLVNNASGWTDAHVGDVSDIHDYPGPKLPAPEDGRALVLGEFGGIGLPLAGHTWLPQNNWGYRSFESLEALGDAYHELLAKLAPLVDQGLSAAIYTQTTDCEIEVNGALTYDREVVKLPADAPALHAALHEALRAALASASTRAPEATPAR
jgi:thiol-disulfide isomerase/thioredoxin